jgi:hypothetical protein
LSLAAHVSLVAYRFPCSTACACVVAILLFLGGGTFALSTPLLKFRKRRR